MVQSHLHLPEASEIAILEQQSLLLLLQEPPLQEKREQESPAHQRLVSKAASVQKTEERKVQPAWRLRKKEMQGFLMEGVKIVQKETFANQVLEISPTDPKGVSTNRDLEPVANRKEDSANRKHPEAIGLKGVSTNQDLVQEANRKEDSANRKHLDLVVIGPKGVSTNQDLEPEANQKEDSANRKHLDLVVIGPKGVSTNQDLEPEANQKEDSANRKHLDPVVIGPKGVLTNQDLEQEANPKEDSANQSLVNLVKEGNSARMVPVKKTRAGDLTEIKNLLATAAVQGRVSKKVRLEAVSLPPKTVLEFSHLNR